MSKSGYFQNYIPKHMNISTKTIQKNNMTPYTYHIRWKIISLVWKSRWKVFSWRSTLIKQSLRSLQEFPCGYTCNRVPGKEGKSPVETIKSPRVTDEEQKGESLNQLSRCFCFSERFLCAFWEAAYVAHQFWAGADGHTTSILWLSCFQQVGSNAPLSLPLRWFGNQQNSEKVASSSLQG